MTIAKLYLNALDNFSGGSVDWYNDTIKVALCSSSYTPNQDAHYWMSDITGELTGGGYARQATTGQDVVQDTALNTVTLVLDNIVFPGLTAANIRYAIFFVDSGTDASSPLVCYYDFETDIDVTLANFTVTINPSGLIVLNTP